MPYKLKNKNLKEKKVYWIHTPDGKVKPFKTKKEADNYVQDIFYSTKKEKPKIVVRKLFGGDYEIVEEYKNWEQRIGQSPTKLDADDFAKKYKKNPKKTMKSYGIDI